MGSRGQGALEYLLLIGGAVLIAAVAITLLSSSASSGKNTAQNAQNSYAADITGLQAVGGIKIYGSETITELTAPASWFLYSAVDFNKRGDFQPEGFKNESCDGLPDQNCVVASGNNPQYNTLEFKVLTKIGTAYKVTFKVADYVEDCNLSNVLQLSFLVNGTVVKDWNGNSVDGNRFGVGGWAYPSITFTANGSDTNIAVQNKYNSSCTRRGSCIPKSCFSDLNLILNWLKLETA